MGYLVSIPVLGRSPRGGHGYQLQYSYLENRHGQRSLAGHSPCGRKESDTNKWLSTRVSASPSSWPPKGQGQEGGEETRGAHAQTLPDLGCRLGVYTEDGGLEHCYQRGFLIDSAE